MMLHMIIYKLDDPFPPGNVIEGYSITRLYIPRVNVPTYYYTCVHIVNVWADINSIRKLHKQYSTQYLGIYFSGSIVFTHIYYLV